MFLIILVDELIKRRLLYDNKQLYKLIHAYQTLKQDRDETNMFLFLTELDNCRLGMNKQIISHQVFEQDILTMNKQIDGLGIRLSIDLFGRECDSRNRSGNATRKRKHSERMCHCQVQDGIQLIDGANQ